MDEKNKKLLEILDDDELGLLKSVPPKAPPIDEDSRLVNSFKEIIEFYKQNNREPKPDGQINEAKLYYRLEGLRKNDEKSNKLASYDNFDLLTTDKVRKPGSLEEILEDDSLNLLNGEGEVDIFNLKHVQKQTTMPKYVARRNPCKDFELYENIFKKCQSDLSTGKRQLLPFSNEQQIEKGYFFVLKGVLLYIAEIGSRKKERGKTNARLRCIFENGTESKMLLRSLSAELYKNGRRVTESNEKLLGGFSNITDEDQEMGYIYILKSKSNDPQVKSIKELYKIGYSGTNVENRIRGAEKSPTYLMAPVSIVETYRCYNINPQKFEDLIHAFFGEVCLNLEVQDSKGKKHIPREWFVVPLDVIEQAIYFILNGEIAKYRYDVDNQQIVLNNN